MPHGHTGTSHHHQQQQRHRQLQQQHQPEPEVSSDWRSAVSAISHSIRTLTTKMDERGGGGGSGRKRKLAALSSTGEEWVMTYRETPLGAWVLAPPGQLAAANRGAIDAAAASIETLPAIQRVAASLERPEAKKQKLNESNRSASKTAAVSPKPPKEPKAKPVNKKSAGSKPGSTTPSGGAMSKVVAVPSAMLQHLETTINDVATFTGTEETVERKPTEAKSKKLTVKSPVGGRRNSVGDAGASTSTKAKTAGKIRAISEMSPKTVPKPTQLRGRNGNVTSAAAAKRESKRYSGESAADAPTKKVKATSPKSVTSTAKSSPAVVKRLAAALKKKKKTVAKAKTGGLGFWKGARLRRMASLNAQAKMHVLYENDARPPNSADDCSSPSSPATDDDYRAPNASVKAFTNSADAPSTSRSKSPARSSGSPAGAKKLVAGKAIKGKTASSPSEQKPKKGTKAVKKGGGKGSKKVVALCRKVATVPKRMASLNAQAILAASYSLERHVRLPKEKAIAAPWRPGDHSLPLPLPAPETKPLAVDEEAMPAFYPPSPLNYVVQHIAAIKEDTIRQVIDAVVGGGSVTVAQTLSNSVTTVTSTAVKSKSKTVVKKTAVAATRTKKSVTTTTSCKGKARTLVKESSGRRKKATLATTVESKIAVATTATTTVTTATGPMETERGRHKKKKRCSCCEAGAIAERRSSSAASAATPILADDDVCLKEKAEDLVSQIFDAAEQHHHHPAANVKAEEVRRDKIEEDTAEVTITGMYINPMTNTSQSFCISRIHTYKQASSTHSFAQQQSLPAPAHRPSTPHGAPLVAAAGSNAAILQPPNPLPIQSQQQQQHHLVAGGGALMHPGHGSGPGAAHLYPYSTGGGSQPCGGMGSVPLVDARHYSSAFAVPHYGHHGAVSYAPHGYYQTTGPMIQSLPDPCHIHKPVPFHPHPFANDGRCSTTGATQPLQPFPTTDQCHSHPAPPYPPPGPGPGGQPQPAPLSAGAGHSQQQQQQLLSPAAQSAVPASLQQQPVAAQLYPAAAGVSPAAGTAHPASAAPPCGIHSQPPPPGGADSKCNLSLGPAAAAAANGLLPAGAPTELYFADGSCQSCVAAAMAAAVAAEHYARPPAPATSGTAASGTAPAVPPPPTTPPPHQQRSRSRLSSSVVVSGTTGTSTTAADPYARLPPAQPDVGRQNALPTQTKTDHGLHGGRNGRPLFAPKIVKVESVSESSVSVASTSSSSSCSESDEREAGSSGRLQPLNLSVAKGYDGYSQPMPGARHHMTTRRVKHGGTFGSPPSPSMAVGVAENGGRRGESTSGNAVPPPPPAAKDSTRSNGQRRSRATASPNVTASPEDHSPKGRKSQQMLGMREVRVALSAEDVFNKSSGMVASWFPPQSTGQGRRQQRRKEAGSSREDRRLLLRQTASLTGERRRAGCRFSGQQASPAVAGKSPSPTRQCASFNGAQDKSKAVTNVSPFDGHLVVRTRSSRATADSTPIQKREGLRNRDTLSTVTSIAESSATRGRSPFHYPGHPHHPGGLLLPVATATRQEQLPHTSISTSNHRNHQVEVESQPLPAHHNNNNNHHHSRNVTPSAARGSKAVFYGSGNIETVLPSSRRSSSSASSTCSNASSLTAGLLQTEGGVPRQSLSLRSNAVVASSSGSSNSGISSNNRKVPRYSNGWMWDGAAFQQHVYLSNDDPPVLRKCYRAMRHIQGDVISVRDCVLLRSGPRKNDLPFVAKVAALWENPEDGEMMFSLLWYYRPEHTEQGRKPHHMEDEIFASKHRDTNSVACIEDKCYVLTFNEYSRYRSRTRMLEEGVKAGPSVIPPLSGEYMRQQRQPPGLVSSDMAFFCRRVYDFRQKRILKNPS